MMQICKTCQLPKAKDDFETQVVNGKKYSRKSCKDCERKRKAAQMAVSRTQLKLEGLKETPLTGAQRAARYRDKTKILRTPLEGFRESLEAALDRSGSRSIATFLKDIPEEPTAFLEEAAKLFDGYTLIPYRNREPGLFKPRKRKAWSPSPSMSRYVTQENAKAKFQIGFASQDGGRMAYRISAENMLSAMKAASARADRELGDDAENWKIVSVDALKGQIAHLVKPQEAKDDKAAPQGLQVDQSGDIPYPRRMIW